MDAMNTSTLITQLDDSLERHSGESHPIVADAWRRRAVTREQQLIDRLIAANDPVEHGDRVFAIGLDGELRITTQEDEEQ